MYGGTRGINSIYGYRLREFEIGEVVLTVLADERTKKQRMDSIRRRKAHVIYATPFVTSKSFCKRVGRIPQ